MCTRVERICQVDPDGWYAPVIGQELIRCKDCKYYDDREWLKCPMLEPTEKEDYCSRAERKETE